MTSEASPSAVARVHDLVKQRTDSERIFTVHLQSLVLHPGDRVALVGESGSGKSTLLSMLALATPPDDATVFQLADYDILGEWGSGQRGVLAKLRGRAVAYLPQRDGLLSFLSIRDNIKCCAELAGNLPVRNIDDIVQALKLDGLLDALPQTLSGGQRQRAAVACALARRPKLILADEPTAALDADNMQRVMDSLCTLGSELGAAIVLATHQVHLVDDYAFTPYVAHIDGAAPNNRATFKAVA